MTRSPAIRCQTGSRDSINTVTGDGENDRIWGGNGKVYGGSGNDKIAGDAGADLAYGGAGSDMFIFRSLSDGPMSGYDRVMDFVAGTDKIDLSVIDANGAMAGSQAFSFVAAKPFFASAGDLYATANLGGTMIEGDVNGDGITDIRFFMVCDYNVTASDFIL